MLEHMLRSGLTAFICATAISAYAFADGYTQIHVPAGNLIAGLKSLAQQTGVELVYRSEQLEGLSTRGVSGTLSPQEAVKKLLEGTNLRLRTDESSGAMLIAVPTPVAVPTPAAPKASSPDSASTLGATERTLRIAQAQQPESPKRAQSALSPWQPASEPHAASVPEVLVRGSKILNIDIKRTPDDLQPYVVFARETIERSGATSIEGFLKEKLSMNAVVASSSQQASAFGSNSTISLRGLGASQTLILIDGRRTSSYSIGGVPQQPDLNGIPLSAVERIEVLPTTSSGIYGGSATGGVVNVILRRDYSGIETKLTYGDTFDGGGGERRIDAAGGFDLEGGKTSLLFAASYSEAQRLFTQDRELLQRGREHILAVNPASFLTSPTPALGATTNIRSQTGVPLTLKGSNASLGSAITHVPRGYTGFASDGGAALVANAGQYNVDLANTAQISGGANASLVNDPTRASVTATVRREFSHGIRAFLDLGLADTTGYFATNQASSTFTVASTAANNPFNQDITVTTPAFGLDGILETRNRNWRAVGGVIFALPGDWQSEVDYSWSRTRLSAYTPGGLNTAAAPAVRNGSLDVLRDTNQFPVDFSAFQTTPALIHPTTTSLRDVTVRAAGPVWKLPGGPITASTALERREETIGNQIQTPAGATTSTLTPSRVQEVDSLYLELQVPIFSNSNSIRGIRELQLQLAGRHDRYETSGTSQVASTTPELSRSASNDFSSTDPTVGLRFRPTQWLMFRASYGTGFLAPGVNQLVPDAPRQIPAVAAAATGVRDPQRGNEPLASFTLQAGGNSNLQPEQSTSRSAGFVLTPTVLPDLRLSVDWIKIHKQDNITNFPITQDNVNNEALLPGFITRGPASGGFAAVPSLASTPRLRMPRSSKWKRMTSLSSTSREPSAGALSNSASMERAACTIVARTVPPHSWSRTTACPLRCPGRPMPPSDGTTEAGVSRGSRGTTTRTG